MSGKKQTDIEGSQADPRADRTRKALLDSLIGLVHGRRYDEFAVGDIVEDAKVGRSTFYDHYRGKDDMIVETMGTMLGVMSNVAAEKEDPLHLEQVLLHFRENRTFARHMFSSTAARDVTVRITRELAARIEIHLQKRPSDRAAATAIPLHFVAAQVAEGQFALVRAWLSDDHSCGAAELARAMRLSAAASIAALL